VGRFKDLLFDLQRGTKPEEKECPSCGRMTRAGYCYYCGTGQRPPPKSAEQRAADTGRALELWDEAIPIAGTLAEHYLCHLRRIEILPPAVNEVLRFHPRCPFGPRYKRSYWPALVALLRNAVDGQPCGIHRTPIDRNGGKLHSPWTLGTLRQAVIKLWPAPEQGRLLVGEGIETTLSAVQVLSLTPAWALGTAYNLSIFPVLEAVSELHIAVDNDANGVGQAKAKECADRYRAYASRCVRHET
jgi:putative DNA primase/helicase